MPSLERILAPWRGLPTRARRATAGAAALLALWGVALALANHPAVLRRLQGAVREALARRLPEAELGDRVSVDPLFRVTLGPLTLRAERKGAPPVLHADRLKVRPRWTALLAGRAEPASVRLYGVRVEPGERLAELQALAERLRPRTEPPPPSGAAGPSQSAPRAWPDVHLRALVVALPHDGRTVELGPLDVDLSRDRDAARDVATVSLSHRRGGRLEATLRREPSGWSLVAALTELAPGALPSPLADAPVRWSGGTIAGDLTLSARDGATATGRVRGRLDAATFSGERLSPAPVGPVSAELDGTVEAELPARRLALRAASLELLGAVDATLAAEVRVGPGLPFSVTLDVAAIDYRVLVDALPAALRPPPEAPVPSGALGFHLGLAGPLREPASWTVDAGLDLSKVREAARRAPPVSLRAPFTWRPEVEGGEGPPLRVGPENPDFVPLPDLPEHVVRAVTTSEDAGFFAHSGFDFQELRNAFAQGTEAGHVVRGASTITQQLAKNLYLSREKTLARKAREALVAVALEATVPKARLLEIYLNIAEWGPGLWGIGPAAQHYFGKPARELSVREAAFLASIIPNPVRYHGYFVRGELDEAWTDRLRVILLHMTEAGVLTEEQLVEALDAPLVFAGRTADATSAVGDLPLPQPALEPLPTDGEHPPQDDHQRDGGDRSAE